MADNWLIATRENDNRRTAIRVEDIVYMIEASSNTERPSIRWKNTGTNGSIDIRDDVMTENFGDLITQLP